MAWSGLRIRFFAFITLVLVLSSSATAAAHWSWPVVNPSFEAVGTTPSLNLNPEGWSLTGFGATYAPTTASYHAAQPLASPASGSRVLLLSGGSSASQRLGSMPPTVATLSISAAVGQPKTFSFPCTAHLQLIAEAQHEVPAVTANSTTSGRFTTMQLDLDFASHPKSTLLANRPPLILVLNAQGSNSKIEFDNIQILSASERTWLLHTKPFLNQRVVFAVTSTKVSMFQQASSGQLFERVIAFVNSDFLSPDLDAFHLDVGRINQDAEQDIVLWRPDLGAIMWYKTTIGPLSFTERFVGTASNLVAALVLDVTGSGLGDVLAVNTSGHISWFRNRNSQFSTIPIGRLELVDGDAATIALLMPRSGVSLASTLPNDPLSGDTIFARGSASLVDLVYLPADHKKPAYVILGQVHGTEGSWALEMGTLGVAQQHIICQASEANQTGQLVATIGWPRGAMTLPRIVLEMRESISKQLLTSQTLSATDLQIRPQQWVDVHLLFRIPPIVTRLELTIAAIGADTVLFDHIRLARVETSLESLPLLGYASSMSTTSTTTTTTIDTVPTQQPTSRVPTTSRRTVSTATTVPDGAGGATPAPTTSATTATTSNPLGLRVLNVDNFAFSFPRLVEAPSFAREAMGWWLDGMAGVFLPHSSAVPTAEENQVLFLANRGQATYALTERLCIGCRFRIYFDVIWRADFETFPTLLFALRTERQGIAFVQDVTDQNSMQLVPQGAALRKVVDFQAQQSSFEPVLLDFSRDEAPGQVLIDNVVVVFAPAGYHGNFELESMQLYLSHCDARARHYYR
ncbi:uncharacterized protein MONBRDRAFT_12730 [Monosiga brevicollis MX1]|uniref:Uncharacterized protein n=1 Tax=Monosiga brevicollis TaxID=81824 RepID=A9VD52_MONBE|nr:uncharacterized protein MONBRDRAFT_12730 [Monosiga brevicollis MX1]EDQ84540.1 predicted protein [Monosiga brevicollis MX1]|eukprot:XP_001750656.1 hypothetical protein [Monosiga brevicollis MX1]